MTTMSQRELQEFIQRKHLTEWHENKKILRGRLESQVIEYLARGGRIKQIPYGTRGMTEEMHRKIFDGTNHLAPARTRFIDLRNETGVELPGGK